MLKVLVSATNKGGEGKTTTSVNIAEYAAIVLKKRVLCIDLDPQANLSGRYIKMEYDPDYKHGKIPSIHPEFNPETDFDWDGRSSIANIFYGENVDAYPTDIKNLDLMPAYSVKLEEAEAVTKNDAIEKVHNQLSKFLSIPAIAEAYDLVVIDTRPSKGPLTIAAMKAATHLIIPSQMEQFSIEGIYGMQQLWKQETYSRPADRPIKLLGILANQVKDCNLHEQFYNQLSELPGVKEYMLPFKIKHRVIYTEIFVEDANPRSLFEMPPKSIARTEWEAACSHITKEIFNHG
jgi:chromosome partitioning protein